MAARGGRGGGRGGRRGPGGLEAENKFQVSYDPKPAYPVSQNINTAFVICFSRSFEIPNTLFSPFSIIHRVHFSASYCQNGKN
jgi:hypothetical protein